MKALRLLAAGLVGFAIPAHAQDRPAWVPPDWRAHWAVQTCLIEAAPGTHDHYCQIADENVFESRQACLARLKRLTVAPNSTIACIKAWGPG